jgi:TonB family protein
MGIPIKQLMNPYTIIALAVLSFAFADAQTGRRPIQHFEKDGLTFDYPFGWTLSDSSTPGLQSVTIERKGNETQIVVSVERTRSCDFQAEIKNIGSALVERVATQIHAASPVQTSPIRTYVDKSDAEGARLQGVINRKRVTADIYSARFNKHFVSLVYIRNDQDGRAQAAWEMLLNTIKLDLGVMMLYAPEEDPPSSTTRNPRSTSTDGFINGRALALPKPSYPPIARSAHASGAVGVQVVIDETGSVISALAVSGHPLLAPSAVAAARKAKFTPPKFCGEPLRLTGVINYNFVEQ